MTCFYLKVRQYLQSKWLSGKRGSKSIFQRPTASSPLVPSHCILALLAFGAIRHLDAGSATSRFQRPSVGRIWGQPHHTGRASFEIHLGRILLRVCVRFSWLGFFLFLKPGIKNKFLKNWLCVLETSRWHLWDLSFVFRHGHVFPEHPVCFPFTRSTIRVFYV